jgi:hypothetical protein
LKFPKQEASENSYKPKIIKEQIMVIAIIHEGKLDNCLFHLTRIITKKRRASIEKENQNNSRMHI